VRFEPANAVLKNAADFRSNSPAAAICFAHHPIFRLAHTHRIL
jgi:hypothetical protein